MIAIKYEKLIGGGGMSNVYLAHDMILNRDVAIKILRYDFTNEEELHRRFQREALVCNKPYTSEYCEYL